LEREDRQGDDGEHDGVAPRPPEPGQCVRGHRVDEQAEGDDADGDEQRREEEVGEVPRGRAGEAVEHPGVVVEGQVTGDEATDAVDDLRGRLEAADDEVGDRRDEDEREHREDEVAAGGAQRTGAAGGGHAISRSSRRTRRWTRVMVRTMRKNRTVMADARPTLFAVKAVVTAWYITVVVASWGPPPVMM